MTEKHRPPAPTPRATEIDAFLRKLAATPARNGAGRGRLLFAMDATASREPSWKQAMGIQAAMFQETAALGTLDIQLAWYRGFGEFEASPWLASADDLLARMGEVRCLGGQTQIERVLSHAAAETKATKVNAVVFVGDCMEEDADRLCHLAGQLGLLGVPVFLFHEGDDPAAARVFPQIARLSGGACLRFDASSPRQLRDLLSAVAVFAVGGRKALQDWSGRRGGRVPELTHQVTGSRP
ncbi:MAG: VWA domain-containing protein [Alphaproteobacteria bacterium]|nr:VWA domain-containing protein [Alphaproteobacteria bacterium]